MTITTRQLKCLILIGLMMVILPFSAVETDASSRPGSDGAGPKDQGRGTAESPAGLISQPGSFAELAKMAAPAVVNIYVAKNAGIPAPDFPALTPQRRMQGQGSGFIIDPTGYIVTNGHVVQGSNQIKVRLLDKQEYNARIIGIDPKTDLAVIKIDAHDLPFLKFGDSEAVQVGEWVIAIGNPFGLAHTVTAGIISAKSRMIGAGPYDDFLQTDASINPGNSGGPLINTHGEVIGINTLLNTSGQGIGFAIPSNLAKVIIKQLQESGKVIRGWIGVQIQNVNPELAEGFGLLRPFGALINQVFPESPAYQVGLRSGDIIVEYQNRVIEEADTLRIQIASTPIGQKVPIKIIRDKKEMSLEISIAALPENAGRTAARPEPPPKDPFSELGMHVADLTPPQAQRSLGRPGVGAAIREVTPGGPAAQAGMLAGDVILTLNAKEVRGADNLREHVNNLPEGTRLLFLIQRGEHTFYAALAR